MSTSFVLSCPNISFISHQFSVPIFLAASKCYGKHAISAEEALGALGHRQPRRPLTRPSARAEHGELSTAAACLPDALTKTCDFCTAVPHNHLANSSRQVNHIIFDGLLLERVEVGKQVLGGRLALRRARPSRDAAGSSTRGAVVGSGSKSAKAALPASRPGAAARAVVAGAGLIRRRWRAPGNGRHEWGRAVFCSRGA